MSLQNTNLVIQASHLPPTFNGTPDEFFQAMVERMKIVSPTGVSFFIVSDTMPSSNVGPWLKGGTQWWVFDSELKTYVPLDITESEKTWFQVSITTPATSDPPLWLKVAADGNPVGWYWFNGATWVGFTELFDKSVTLAKLASQAALSLISFNAAGDAVAVSGGTSGQIPRINAGGTAVEWVNFPTDPGTVNGLVGVTQNLVIKNQSGDEATQLSVTADSVIMQSNAGDYSVAVSVVDLVDITVSGIGGLDTGTETADTWYYVWLISNGASNGAILSTSPTTPVLPSGYVFKALLGAVYNDSSSDFIGIYQTGREISIDPQTTAGFSAGAVSTLDLSAIIPPVAKNIWGLAECNAGGTSDVDIYIHALTPITVGPGGLSIFFEKDPAGPGNAFFKAVIKVSQNIDVAGTGVSASFLVISGFTI